MVPTFIDPEQYNDESVSRYCRLCVDISWSMCIQEPPMMFVDKLDRGATFDTELFHKYKNAEGDKFDYLVWPSLALHKDGPLISKGYAQPISTDRPPTIESLRNSRPPTLGSRGGQESVRNSEPATEDDHNSWDRGSNLARSRQSNVGQTPPLFYRKEPSTQREPIPRSPYFDPNTRTPRTERSRNGAPDIVVDHHDDRYSRGSQRSYHQGNLTVAWKQDRAPSAP